MRKAARAKAIIESAMPVPLDNIEDSDPLHEETFDIIYLALNKMLYV